MKTSIMVPGSVVTANTATGYLRRHAAHLLANISIESSIVLSDIEERIVAAGFLTWEQVQAIEIEAVC